MSRLNETSSTHTYGGFGQLFVRYAKQPFPSASFTTTAVLKESTELPKRKELNN